MVDVYCGSVQVSNKHYDTLVHSPSDILVFQFKPSSYYHCITALKTYLDDSELDRAKRFHFDKDRNRFIICRVLLKFVLARQSSRYIEDINIGIDSNKKPYLTSDKSVHFNLSHTEDLALIVLNSSEIGVDLEFQNSDYNFKDVLTHVYSKTEINEMLNSKNQIHTFYKFWTRKEAIVKATGEGINEYLLQIPATDGHHKVDSNVISGFDYLKVLSFGLEDNHVGSIAIGDRFNNPETLNIYNLPNSIDGLRSF